MSITAPAPKAILIPGREDKTQFRYVLAARDDERALYAADALEHIRYFASWLADDLYLDLYYGARVRVAVHNGRRSVPDGWQWGDYEDPSYAELVAAAPTTAKSQALLFEAYMLNAQVRRSRADGF